MEINKLVGSVVAMVVLTILVYTYVGIRDMFVRRWSGSTLLVLTGSL